MNDNQFKELMEKLEEIKCGLFDFEEPKNIKKNNNFIFILRKNFFVCLEKRTNWGRNKIKEAFEESINKSLREDQ